MFHTHPLLKDNGAIKARNVEINKSRNSVRVAKLECVAGSEEMKTLQVAVKCSGKKMSGSY